MTVPPFTTTAGFVARFVTPLLGGGAVEVRAPLSADDRDAMLRDAAALLDPELALLRSRVAQRLVAEPSLPDPGADELSLWIGLHNVLALDHPEGDRVWTRAKMWRRVENETRSLLAFGRPLEVGSALALHLAVGAFLDLEREDYVVTDAEGEHRFRGREPARRRFNLFSSKFADIRSERVRWIEQPHRPAAARLLPDLMWVSPLTSLLRPGWAPPGWSPLMAVQFLHSRPYARAICHAWARDAYWLRIGGVIAGSLLRSLDLQAEVFGGRTGAAVPGAAAAMREAAGTGRRLDLQADSDSQSPEADPDHDPDHDPEHDPEHGGGTPLALPTSPLEFQPQDLGAVLGALIHLHLLKVLEFDARVSIGLGARDWAVQTFLAAPLLLYRLEGTLGRPLELDVLGDEALARRWEEHLAHLSGLVPRPIVENLVATLVPRVVERQPA